MFSICGILRLMRKVVNNLLRAYKYRMYPNAAQRLFFAKTFGCVRFVYNKMLHDRKLAYQQFQEDGTKTKHPTPASYKTEFPFLKEVDSLALANAQLNLNEAKDLSRKQKGSRNRNKARLKVAKLHEKIANQRQDFLHKLSIQIIRENQTIVIEDLRVKNMLKNHKVAKAISEASWSEFRRMLTYKTKWYGRNLIVAPINYASSQLCSSCGHKNAEVKNLKVREWVCLACGILHDRDVNAAKNLVKLAG